MGVEWGGGGGFCQALDSIYLCTICFSVIRDDFYSKGCLAMFLGKSHYFPSLPVSLPVISAFFLRNLTDKGL